MYVAFCLATLALAGCGASDEFRTSNSNPFIVGGEDANVGEFPWQILLNYKGYVCGGSIVNNQTILTAAHCVEMDTDQKRGEFIVTAGMHNVYNEESSQQIRKVETVVVHKKYRSKSNTQLNDLAILHLESPLEFTNEIQPVQLSDKAFDKISITSEECVATGYGISGERPQEFPDILQKVKVNIISPAACKKKARRVGLKTSKKQHSCEDTPGMSTCGGDSGGPVGCYGEDNIFRQVGIVSFGPSGLCEVGLSVSARVSTYLKWIQANSV